MKWQNQCTLHSLNNLSTAYTTKGARFTNVFEALNDFHANIKLTVEANPEEILDTENILNNADAGTIKEH